MADAEVLHFSDGDGRW